MENVKGKTFSKTKVELCTDWRRQADVTKCDELNLCTP